MQSAGSRDDSTSARHATHPNRNNARAHLSEIINLPARYMYSHTALPCAEFFKDNEDTEHNTDFVPDMLTHDG
jgi:hypothetical protein